MSGHPIYESFGHLTSSLFCEPSSWPAKSRQSFESNRSSDTVHHVYHQKPVLSSEGSLGSVSKHLRVANENVLPSRNTSQSTLNFVEGSGKLPPLNKASEPTSSKSSWGKDNQFSGLVGRSSASVCEIGPLEDIDLTASCQDASQHSIIGSETEYTPDHGLSFELQTKETLNTRRLRHIADQGAASCRPAIVVTDTTAHPIRRLLSTLRHRHSRPKPSLSVRKERWSLDDFDEDQLVEVPQSQCVKSGGHRKTSSWASSGFVTAVKSATTNIGTLSAPQSQTTRRLAPLRNSKRSSKLSQITKQESVNGNQGTGPMVDEAALERAVQRRRTLEELVSSEESYIADLKVLKNVSVISDT